MVVVFTLNEWSRLMLRMIRGFCILHVRGEALLGSNGHFFFHPIGLVVVVVVMIRSFRD